MVQLLHGNRDTHGGETVTGNPTRHKEDLGRTLIYIDLFYIMNVDPSN